MRRSTVCVGVSTPRFTSLSPPAPPRRSRSSAEKVLQARRSKTAARHGATARARSRLDDALAHVRVHRPRTVAEHARRRHLTGERSEVGFARRFAHRVLESGGAALDGVRAHTHTSGHRGARARVPASTRATRRRRRAT